MKLDQLSYFLETARQEHVGKAARILSISPSAVSHSIAALEEELGTQLFERKGKSIFLTNRGRRLMERAAELLNRTQAIRDELISEDAELQGHYKLGATHVLSTQFLAPAWVELQNKNPSLTGELYTLRSAQVYSGVIGGEFQVGMCFSPQSHPDLNVRTIYQGNLLIGVKRDHPLMALPLGERIKGLNDHKSCLPKSFQGIEVCDAHPIFQKFGVKPQIDMAYDSYDIAIEKVANSTSWSIFPDLFFKWNATRIRPLGRFAGWKAPYNISLIWPKHQYLPRVLAKLMDNLQSRLLNGPN